MMIGSELGVQGSDDKPPSSTKPEKIKIEKRIKGKMIFIVLIILNISIGLLIAACVKNHDKFSAKLYIIFIVLLFLIPLIVSFVDDFTVSRNILYSLENLVLITGLIFVLPGLILPQLISYFISKKLKKSMFLTQPLFSVFICLSYLFLLFLYVVNNINM